MFSVSVTVLYWHPKYKMVSNVNKTTGTEDRERHNCIIMQNTTLFKIHCNTAGFQDITNQRLENVSHTITHASIPH
jgi:hypothetical protein